MSGRTIKRRELIASSFPITVYRDFVTADGGAERSYTVAEHPGAVVILPIANDGSILALRQFRHAIGREIVELPAGTLEVGEEPRACAERELIEETGFAAARWVSLGTLLPAPGFCNEIQHCFLATELTPAYRPADEDEEIEVYPLAIAQFAGMVASNEIVDAKSLGCFLRAVLGGDLRLPAT